MTLKLPETTIISNKLGSMLFCKFCMNRVIKIEEHI